jgi:hypothetical protein
LLLRPKKLRRQRDPTSASATEFVAQRTSERYRRLVGTIDERRRSTAGRRSAGRKCVRCARKDPEDSQLLVPAVEQHQRLFGRAPGMVAADTGFYSLKNENSIQGMGVTRVAVPSRSTKSSERRKLQRTRWFRAGQRWRTGCEGRISVLKRRHGLNRCRYRGFEGMQRWVGLGVLADNVIHIGRCLALQRA